MNENKLELMLNQQYVVCDSLGNLINPFDLNQKPSDKTVTWMSKERYMEEFGSQGTTNEGNPIEALLPPAKHIYETPGIVMDESMYGFEYSDKLRECGKEITETVVEKNEAYGDAINKVATIMLTLFPEGIDTHQYMDMLLLVRDLDKTCRIADGDPAAFDENPWKDKAGYGICGMATQK